MKGWQVVFERGVLFAVFVAMLCVSNPALLYGSEDSLQEVMEGYESPQKLFAPQDIIHKISTKMGRIPSRTNTHNKTRRAFHQEI